MSAYTLPCTGRLSRPACARSRIDMDAAPSTATVIRSANLTARAPSLHGARLAKPGSELGIHGVAAAARRLVRQPMPGGELVQVLVAARQVVGDLASRALDFQRRNTGKRTQLKSRVGH